MKSLFKLLCLSFAMIALLGSCKDEITFEPTPSLEIPNEAVTATLTGVVFDEDRTPVEGALVTVNNNVTTTDENGGFIFRDIVMNSYGELINIEKDGFFKNVKFFESEANTVYSIEAMMITKELVGSFSAGAASTFPFDGEASVAFSDQGIVDANGNPFTGDVNVYAHWYDPSSLDLGRQMPGDLRAADRDNQIVQLATYGMVAVELEDNNGASLQLAEGHNATLTFPLPGQFSSAAPSSIPMWHFDESDGYWKEEGQAQLVDGNYVGQVSHFSFWNCDAPFPLIKLKGKVVLEDGSPVINQLVQICTGFTGARCGWTNGLGVFCGKVPKGEPLVLKLVDQCGEEVLSIDLGSFTEDVDLGEIVLPPSNEIFSFTAQLIDCEGAPVTEGYLRVEADLGGYVLLYTDEMGQVSGSLSTCEPITELVATGIDIENEKQSETTTYDVTGLSTLDLGVIEICDELEKFIKYSIDGGQEILLTEVWVSQDSTSTGGNSGLSIFGNDPNINTEGVGINLDDDQLGTHIPTYMYFSDVDGTFYSCQSCEEVTLEITLNEGPGGIVRGNFSGNLDSNNGSTTIAVTGSFKGRLD